MPAVFTRPALGVGLIACALASGCATPDSAPTPAPLVDRGHATEVPSLDHAATIRSHDGVFTVRYVTQPAPPPMNQPFSVELLVEFPGDQAPRPFALSVDADMPEHGHGMNLVPTIIDRGGGRFRVEHMLFHMPGLWEIYFDVSREGITSRAQDEITLE